MIVEYIRNNHTNDPTVIADIVDALSYPVSARVLDHVQNISPHQDITWLFSGSWRLPFASRYIELRCFRHANVGWHANTLFLEPEESTTYHYMLAKLRIKTLVILHSDYWVSHKPIELLMQELKDISCWSDQTVLTVPIKHTNFNKLKYSTADICQSFNASVIDDCFIFRYTKKK